MSASVDRSARLPVGEMLAATWHEGRAGFGTYASLCIIPLSAVLLLRLGQAVYEPRSLLDPGGWSDEVEWSSKLFLMLLAEAVTILALVPAFTAWHRYLALGPADPAVRLSYSFGDEEWRYLNVALRLGVLYLIPALFGLALWDEFGFPPGETNLFLILAWLPLARWLLLFPAAAVGRVVEGRWRDWAVPGNALRLWLVVAVPETIGWLVDMWGLAALSSEEPQIAPAVIYALFNVAIEFVTSAFAVAALSISYRRLVHAAGETS